MTEQFIESATPGALKRSEFTVENVKIPVVIIKGVSGGPAFGVTAGIHGSEYNTLMAAFQIIERVSPQEMFGTLVVLPLVNPPAFKSRTLYTCPLDGKNINRIFPGNPNGSVSEKIAASVFELITRNCQFLVDLHCGDLIEDLGAYASYKITGNPEVDGKMDEMASRMNLGAILAEKGGFQGTLTGEVSKFGIPSIVAECGGRGVTDPECVEQLYRGVRNNLVELGLLRGKSDKLKLSERFQSFCIVNSGSDGVLVPLKKPGKNASRQEELAVVKNYMGTVVETLRAPKAGKILFFTGPPVEGGEMAAVLLV